jgi:hypothetical protein
MNAYVIRLKHDKGYINITVNATSEDDAKAMVLRSERAPESAIISITRLA